MKKLLAALVAGLAFFAPVSARAQDSKSTVISAINTDFADNTAGAITAALLRTVTTQMVSSYVDYILCGAQGGTAYWNGSSPPAPSCLVKGTNGQVLRTAPTPFWDNLANALIAGTGISITGTITPTITSTVSTGSIGAVPTSRIISSGAGLLGGGDLSADRTLSISPTITAGGPTGDASTIPVITYNDKGQLTAVTSAAVSTSALVPISRIISSGAGLLGGGDLSANRTLSISSVIAAGGPSGSSTSVPTITYNDKGQLTAVSVSTIPTGSSSTLGLLRVDNTTITATAGGIITAVGAAATAITVGTTTIGSGASGNILYNNGGVLGELPQPTTYVTPAYGPTTTAPSQFGLFKTVKAMTIDNVVAQTGSAATAMSSLVVKAQSCGTSVGSCGSPVDLATCSLSNTANVGVDCTINSASVAAGQYVRIQATGGSATVYDLSIALAMH